MESNIGVGAIVGLITASSIYVWNSELFSKSQKVFILLLILFPPAHWIAIIIIYFYNKSNNSKIIVSSNVINLEPPNSDNLEFSLDSLRQNGIISDDEFYIKLQEIKNRKAESDFLNSKEYKQLKILLDSNILSKEEFHNKCIILKNKLFSISNTSITKENTEIIYEIGLWNKLTNYDKVLGKFMTIEIISENETLNGHEINKKIDDEKYFLYNDLSSGFFNNVEDLLYVKFQIRTRVFKAKTEKNNLQSLNIPKPIKKKTISIFNIVGICMIVLLLLIIAFAILGEIKTNSYDENYQVESPIDSSATNFSTEINYPNTTNNHNQTYDYKRYIYIVVTATVPKLNVSQISGYTDFSTDIHHPTQYFYSTEWMESIYTTEIVEIKNYTDDEKHTLLDETELDVKIKISYANMDYQTELSIKCNDATKREMLANEKARILDKKIYDFSTYAEASMHKQNTNTSP